MENSERVWEAYLLSKSLRTRPSDVYGIRGEFRRYCFDKAVVTFGTALEAALEEVEAKTDKARALKRARVLDRWLDRELKYRNPVATAKKTTPGPGPKAPDVEQEYVMRGDGTERPD